jgi:hypothetical protein
MKNNKRRTTVVWPNKNKNFDFDRFAMKIIIALTNPFLWQTARNRLRKTDKEKKKFKNVILWIGTFIALEVGPSPINSINPNISAVKH